jgi:plasmid stability protein
MEAEARCILQTALDGSETRSRNLYERIRERFEPFGGVTLELPPVTPARAAPLRVKFDPRCPE